ncbi:hypothetical protein HGRIS_011221 [Hohenbuehelia grisea]|uniref:Uncharacterized protein n=1 Tax=Hohenbuehelia grisea TaxID=104357 RepID=A0ABR3JVC6_9AGAR
MFHRRNTYKRHTWKLFLIENIDITTTMSQVNSRFQSRAASASPQPEMQQERPGRSQSRGPEIEEPRSRSPSVASSDGESPAPGNRNPKRRTKQNRRQRNDSRALANRHQDDTVASKSNDAVNRADNRGEVQKGGNSDDSNPLKLRLDLNLDAEIELKAKVHGDVTLSLL